MKLFSGTLIEKILGKTKYKGWINVGRLDRGFFPQIEFITESAKAKEAA